MSLFHVNLLSLFPEMFPGSLAYSLAGKALQKGIWSYDVVNIRDFGITQHKNVDDEPCGGGNGLIMRPDVLGHAIDSVLANYQTSTIYYPTPRGSKFNQSMAHKISKEKNRFDLNNLHQFSNIFFPLHISLFNFNFITTIKCCILIYRF